MKTFARGIGLVAFLLVLTLLPLPGTAVPAHAGAFSGIKNFFQLPGEVDKLQDNYQQMQEQYEDTRQELESARKQAEDTALKAQQTSEQLLAEQGRLARENARLAEENKQLAATLEELKNTDELRQKANKRLRTALYTGAALLAAIFFAGRFTRFALRKSR